MRHSQTLVDANRINFIHRLSNWDYTHSFSRFCVQCSRLSWLKAAQITLVQISTCQPEHYRHSLGGRAKPIFPLFRAAYLAQLDEQYAPSALSRPQAGEGKKNS